MSAISKTTMPEAHKILSEALAELRVAQTEAWNHRDKSRGSAEFWDEKAAAFEPRIRELSALVEQ